MRTITLIALSFIPLALYAASIDRFVFINAPQVVSPSAVSEVFTVEAQDASGTPVNGTTVCIEVSSSSGTGEFSTNGTEWGDTPFRVLALTLSSNQYRRNFYFRDSTSGVHTITVHASPRPSDSTCPAYNVRENAVWTTSHQVTVGNGVTPPSANSSSTPDNPSSQSTSTASTGSAPLTPQILAYAGEDRTVFVGADSAFKGYAEGITGDPLQNARFVWSFGNGDQREGQNVAYHFAYPGRYVVVLEVANGLYSASDRVMVEAVPAAVAITDVTSDYIALKNESSVELDLAGWFLFASGARFAFPPNTILMPQQEVLVSNARTGLSGAEPSTVALQFPNGLVASVYQAPLFLARSAPTPSLSRGRATTPVGAAAAGQVADLAGEVSLEDAALITAPVVAAEGLLPRSSPTVIGWLATLLAFIVLVSAGFIVVRRSGYSEYSIKEIKE